MADVDAGALRIIDDDLSGDDIRELLRLHAEGMLANSPEGACHFLRLDDLRDPSVTVWSAWDGNSLAGCGALRELDARHGEIKSMRTAPGHLGRGVGTVDARTHRRRARSRSYERLSLETGRGDAFGAAVHLYESFGFERCGPFGDYAANEFSQFFTLAL